MAAVIIGIVLLIAVIVSLFITLKDPAQEYLDKLVDMEKSEDKKDTQVLTNVDAERKKINVKLTKIGPYPIY